MNHPLTIWTSAFITLTVLSYLWKDNIAYRIAQRAAMGASLGIVIALTWQQILQPYWWTPISAAIRGAGPKSGLLWLLVLIPGSFWYCQLSKKWFWLSRFVFCLFIGVAAGLAFKGQILLIIPQLGAAIRPLNPWAMEGGATGANLLVILNNLLFMIGMFTTLLYFCFTINTTNRAMRVPIRIGRVFIMIALGGMFGNTVMTRMSFLIERLQFLYSQCLAPIVSFFGG
jgi:hypothetical protein